MSNDISDGAPYFYAAAMILMVTTVLQYYILDYGTATDAQTLAHLRLAMGIGYVLIGGPCLLYFMGNVVLANHPAKLSIFQIIFIFGGMTLLGMGIWDILFGTGQADPSTSATSSISTITGIPAGVAVLWAIAYVYKNRTPQNHYEFDYNSISHEI